MAASAGYSLQLCQVLCDVIESQTQNDIIIVAGIEARQTEAIRTNVLDFRLVVSRAVSA